MLTLKNLMKPTDLGKFSKLQQSFMATVRARAKSQSKWVTGRSASLLHGSVNNDNDVLTFEFHKGTDTDGEQAQFAQLETGRQAGKVPRGFAQIIYDWSLNRGISFTSIKDRKRFAYLTARKIANEGTELHKSGERLSQIYTIPYKKFIESVNKFVDAWIRTLANNEIKTIDKIAK